MRKEKVGHGERLATSAPTPTDRESMQFERIPIDGWLVGRCLSDSPEHGARNRGSIADASFAWDCLSGSG
jgi:hypothetical protein